jgi:hypothetical protein
MVEWDGVRPAVHVIVNGLGPYLFLVDTGAGGEARADTRLVERLGLRPSGTYPADDGSAAAAAAHATMPKYVLGSIRLGTLTRRQVETPGRSYNGNPRRTPIDGILGYRFFAGCLLTLDYRRREVRVGPGALRPGPGVIAYARDDGGPQVPIGIGSQTTLANLDTGDREAFTLPWPMAARLPLAAPPRVVGTGQSANNAFEIREAPLAGSIRIGTAAWTRPSVQFADVFDNLNVGSAALQDAVVTFDQNRRLVRLRRRGR